VTLLERRKIQIFLDAEFSAADGVKRTGFRSIRFDACSVHERRPWLPKLGSILDALADYGWINEFIDLLCVARSKSAAWTRITGGGFRSPARELGTEPR
jgi:hypothetical protein